MPWKPLGRLPISGVDTAVSSACLSMRVLALKSPNSSKSRSIQSMSTFRKSLVTVEVRSNRRRFLDLARTSDRVQAVFSALLDRRQCPSKSG